MLTTQATEFYQVLQELTPKEANTMVFNKDPNTLFLF